MPPKKVSLSPPSAQVPGQALARFARISRQAREILCRSVAHEVPVAIEINSFGFAVLMASPVGRCSMRLPCCPNISCSTA